eukprot:s1043_g35.t1
MAPDSHLDPFGPDQSCVCDELLTTSFAAALQQLMHSGQQGLRGEAEPLSCAVSYLELARMLEDDLQKRLSKVVTGRSGLEQHVLLGFSQDPSSCNFLQPKEQVCQVPRALQPPGKCQLPSCVLANLMAGSGGDPRWPNVLVQLCRIDKEDLAEVPQGRVPAASGQLHPLARPLLSAEVLGEFWLPPLAHMFPETVLPGDPPTPRKPPTPRPRGAFQTPRNARVGLKTQQRPRKGFPMKSCHIARKELWCRLRAPSLGTQQQYCTWGAALQGVGLGRKLHFEAEVRCGRQHRSEAVLSLACHSFHRMHMILWVQAWRLRALLKLGASPAVQDGLAHTPLHWAARQGFEGISQALVSAQASIQAENRDRITPLHLAAQSNSGSIVRATQPIRLDATAADQRQSSAMAALGAIPGLMALLVRRIRADQDPVQPTAAVGTREDEQADTDQADHGCSMQIGMH